MDKNFKLLVKEFKSVISDLEDLKKVIPKLFSTKMHLKLQTASLLKPISKKGKKIDENPVISLLKGVTADKKLSKAAILYLTSVVDHGVGLAKDTLSIMEALYPALNTKEQEKIIVVGYDILQKCLVAKEMIKDIA